MAAEIVGAVGKLDREGGIARQRFFDKGHLGDEFFAVSAADKGLKTEQMVRAKMEDGKVGLHHAALPVAGTTRFKAASIGGATSMTATILIRSPGRKGITQAARDAPRVMPVWAMNHAVPRM